MLSRDVVAAMLIAVAVVAGTVGGFLVSAAVGWYTLAGFTFVLGMLLAVSEAPAPPVPEQTSTPEPTQTTPTRTSRGGRSK